MARKKKVEEPVAEAAAAPVEAKQPEGPKFDWEYGDLAVICKCGRTQILQREIEQGLQLVIVNREESYIQLKCDECEAELTLRLIKGFKPEAAVIEEAVETKTDEVVQEESKQESSL